MNQSNAWMIVLFIAALANLSIAVRIHVIQERLLTVQIQLIGQVNGITQDVQANHNMLMPLFAPAEEEK